MKTGIFQAGEHVLRAKIDMKSPNLNMRDPILYKIRHVNHHRQAINGVFTHFTILLSPLSEPLKNHSLYLHAKFEDHKPIYNWVVKSVVFVAFLRIRFFLDNSSLQG